jgi:long-chain acyl-CoA synthetase
MEEKRWLNHYDEGVPHTLEPYPPLTLLDYLAVTARQRPAHPAIFFKGRWLTYGQLARLSDAFAAALVELGVKKGDRLALLLPNCPQFIIAEVGAWKVGAIITPLNPLYSERELIGLLAGSGAETVVVLTSWYTRIKSVQPRTALKRVIATSIKEYLPLLVSFLFTLIKERREGHRIRLQAPDLWLRDLLKGYALAPRLDTLVGPDDPAVILMSGGTTGTPKGALGRHRSLVAAALQSHAWLQPVWEDWHDIVMLPVPLFHAYGCIGGQGTAFVGHNPLVLIPDPRDITDVIRTIGWARPTFFIAVPTLFNALLNHPAVNAGRVDLRSIKLCFSGAAPLPVATKQRFEALTGACILEAYSLTEAMLASTCSPVRGLNKLGSVGVPLSDVELHIVDMETGERSLDPGEVGEVIMRAPQLMSGYWQNVTETVDALRVHGSGGRWLHTGDLGWMDDDGYIFLVERKKDLIKTSGYQVWPREIEEVIALHPAVAEVGVAGVPDARQGEAVKAWVVLHPGTSTTSDDIRRHCQSKLAPHKVPQVEFCHELPKTIIGKVRRRTLVEPQASQEEEGNRWCQR